MVGRRVDVEDFFCLLLFEGTAALRVFVRVKDADAVAYSKRKYIVCKKYFIEKNSRKKPRKSLIFLVI